MEGCMKNNAYIISFLLVIFLLLAGCDYKIEEQENNTTSETQEVTSGAVVSAPIDNAIVEAYIDDNWVAVGTTKQGYIHFSDIEKITTYPILLRANAGGEGRNAKTGSFLKAELRGIMMSREDTAYLTPVTTLAAVIFQLNGSTATAANTAKKKVTSLVQKTLGFTDLDPFANPLGDSLLKHEVLQQTFMMVLDLGAETDDKAMRDFITNVTVLAENMQNDTFLGAAQKLNKQLPSSIGTYIEKQKENIVARASGLLSDKEKEPIDQEKERNEFITEMNEIITNSLIQKEIAECFVLDQLTEDIAVVAPLPAQIATPQKTNLIPLHFRVSLLSNKDSVTFLTENNTKALIPTYAGGFKISAVPETGILNEGQLISPNAEQQIFANTKTYSNGTEFSFFFDFKTAPIDSQHTITFTAADDPTITHCITFIVKGEDDVVIESVSSTGTSKLFAFDEGTNFTIPIGAVATLSEGQLAASVTPAFDTTNPEDVFDAVWVQFTAPQGFAFRSDNKIIPTAIVAVLPTAANSSFTFALPSIIDIVATAPSTVGEKKISIEVLDQETKNVVCQTYSTVYFVPENSLGAIANAVITKQPSSDITYNHDEADSDIILDSFIIHCELKTWYDLAGIPKEEQPIYPIEQYPSTWKLRFDNVPTGNNGFKSAHGEYSTELDLQPFAFSQAQTPMEFGLSDFRGEGGSDCRQTIKPFSESDTIRLYYAFDEDPKTEHMAEGTINVMEQP